MNEVHEAVLGTVPDLRNVVAFLVRKDVADFSVLDDRGNTGGWLVVIEDDTWKRLPARTRTSFTTRYGFTRRNAAGTLSI